MDGWRPVVSAGPEPETCEVTVVDGVAGSAATYRLRSGGNTEELLWEIAHYRPELHLNFALQTTDSRVLPLDEAVVPGSVLTLAPGQRAITTVPPVIPGEGWLGTVAITPSATGDSHRVISRGVNFRAKCCNSACPAYHKAVYVPRGFGTFSVEREMLTAKCPTCGKRTEKADEMCVFQAKFSIEGMTRGEHEYSIQNCSTVPGKCAVFLDKESSEWAFLMATVIELS